MSWMRNDFPDPENSKPVKWITGLGLVAIIALGAFLRFYQLGASGIGNEYYAAAVKSMLTSWHNFFFVSFEPGGSVSVDKPPLGFWLETLSAYFLGVNGFALAFPNALAGTLSLPLLFTLVKRPFGWLAGLFSALVLAVMPITIATERNNTVDGLLVFFLLSAAWATWRAVESGKLRYLLLGAMLVGLGFNIKMLQAYMVLPALGALYFFGARHSWNKRIAHLGLAGGLLLVVSFSWVWIVDAVPAAARPFIGSSTDNTVMELIIGHNGIKRLFGGPGSGPNTGRAPQPGGQPPAPGAPLPGQNGQGSPPGGPNEVGQAGILRLFSQPLADQASWLLPLALAGLLLALAALGRPWPLSEQHLGILLWAGWLIPIAGYFSVTTGLWHTYYLIMLGPGIAGLCGAAVWAWLRFSARSPRRGWLLVALSSAVAIGFEAFILSAYPTYLGATTALMVGVWLAGLALFWVRPRAPALCLILLSLMVGPLLWSGLTTFNQQPDAHLPKAGPGNTQPAPAAAGDLAASTQQKILDYLLSHTPPAGYLGATLDSHGAAFYILASGRPFLTFGGFNGSDTVVTLSQLQKMIAAGRLRYILDDNSLSAKAELYAWVSTTCKIVRVPGISGQPRAPAAMRNPRDPQFSILYDCGE